jgi:L-fuculose-phosphate aldolase
VPDTHLFPQAHRVCGDVGYAHYAVPGSERLGENIAGTFGVGHHCVILENHGAVTGAGTLQEAFQRFETLEFTGKTIIKAGTVGPVHYLTDDQIEDASRAAPSLEEFEPDCPCNRERELRKAICDVVVRGYEQRLVTSTGGSFSARVDERSFLITPFPVDRCGIEPGDIVLIRDGKRERGRTPSRAVLNHGAIYSSRPEINAIVNAFPVNATAFSVCNVPLNIRVIPESYVFLRDVRKLAYGIQYGDGEALSREISARRPVALLENDGVLVTGKTVLEAFDKLEVLESTAEAVINSYPIGGTQPMSDAVIEELERTFPIE